MSVAALLLLATSGPFSAPAVADGELADMRGGFRLPGGIDVAMTVQTQTAVDGMVVLRTVFRADQGPPTLLAFTPRDGSSVASPNAGQAGGDQTAAMPSISYDPRGGIRVTPGVNAPGGITITAGATGQGGLGAVPDGLQPAGSEVRQEMQGKLSIATLNRPDISVVHFAGAAFGSAIANVANDRLIETQTSVAIDLSNAGPDVLGSSMLRAQDLTFNGFQMRGR